MIAAGIDRLTAPLLGGSPDAVRMLLWLGEQCPQGTLIQAREALACLGAPVRGGPAPVDVKTSKALESLTHFAKATGTTDDVPPSPCGHCGRVNEKASGNPGEHPEPGMFVVCSGCGGVNQFDDELKHVIVTDEEIDTLEEPFRSHLHEMRDLIRSARMGRVRGSAGPSVKA
jgi:hypothetical protein